MGESTANSGRSYPRTCTKCREKRVRSVAIDRPMDVKYEGMLHSIIVRGMPAERCENCGATTYGNDSDAAVDRALRKHLGLLMAEEIRDARKALGISQIELASAIRCAKESVCRWEGGLLVQSRAYDRLLRAYFGSPEVRGLFRAIDRGEEAPILVEADPFVGFVPVGVTNLSDFNLMGKGQVYSSLSAVGGPKLTIRETRTSADFLRLVRTEDAHAA